MSEKLSPQMLAVLASIAWPNAEDDPFPPVNTIKALSRRGLIRMHLIREPQNVFEMLCGRQFSRLRVSQAGFAALKDAGLRRPRSPSPQPQER